MPNLEDVDEEEKEKEEEDDDDGATAFRVERCNLDNFLLFSLEDHLAIIMLIAINR